MRDQIGIADRAFGEIGCNKIAAIFTFSHERILPFARSFEIEGKEIKFWASFWKIGDFGGETNI